MGFWTIVMGIYGGGSASVAVTGPGVVLLTDSLVYSVSLSDVLVNTEVLTDE